MENKGKIIVLEGACDSVGKTTQLKMLKEELNEPCASWHFPSYGTAGAYLVEQYLAGEFGSLDEVPQQTVHALYAIDRNIEWLKNLQKEYNQGKTLLFDRYTTSSFIYQTLQCKNEEEKKDMIAQIKTLEYYYFKLPEPDLVIFLNGDFQTLTKLRLARTDNAGVQNDIFEANIETQRKLYESA